MRELMQCMYTVLGHIYFIDKYPHTEKKKKDLPYVFSAVSNSLPIFVSHYGDLNCQYKVVLELRLTKNEN